MEKIYKINDYPDLIKDGNSGAVLTINNDALQSYKKQRQLMESLKNNVHRIDRIENEVAKINNNLEKILGLLNDSNNK